MRDNDQKKRILVAEETPSILKTVVQILQTAGYEVLTATNGAEALEIAASQSPDLVILDLMLPRMHGIDVLRNMKITSTTKAIGVIVATGRALYQDYLYAIESGADYYLIKPYEESELLRLIDTYFEGKLKPAPFTAHGQDLHLYEGPPYYPHIKTSNSYIKLWGTRGSIPVSGPEYSSYGGNTSCLEIHNEDTIVIIDAGTGIRPLGQELLRLPYRNIHIFIGHTHWDHILGFPFFAPVYYKDYNIKIYAAKGFGKSVRELFTGMLDHDYFPVKLDEMQAHFEFVDLQDNRPITIGDLTISYCYASHPGATLAFKIQSLKQTIGYVTDNEMLVGYHGHPAAVGIDHPLLTPYLSFVEFFKNCDLLIHEAQYTPEEYLGRIGWGHSSIANAAVLVKHTNAKRWMVTHHDPSHTDQMLRDKLLMHQAILNDCGVDCEVTFAYDSLLFSL